MNTPILSRCANAGALACLVAISLVVAMLSAQEPPAAKAKTPTVLLTVATEDAQEAPVKLELKSGRGTQRAVLKTVEVIPGPTQLALSEVPDGNLLLYFSAPGYATQWRQLTLNQGIVEPGQIPVKLYRKKYVVLRYAFNTAGGQELSGPNVKEGRAVLGHWGGLPYFRGDWQVWQKSSGSDMFGDVPFLEFHRQSTGYGFAQVPKGTGYNDVTQAPAKIQYQCTSLKAEKGLTLYCHVQGNSPSDAGYGKVIVEDVTETPPPDLKVIERR